MESDAQQGPKSRLGESLLALCHINNVPEGGSVKITLAPRRELAVFRIDGEIFVTNDKCTHGIASLSEGEVENHVVTCPFHGGCFDIRTGEPLAEPAVKPLKTYPVSIIEGWIAVEREKLPVHNIQSAPLISGEFCRKPTPMTKKPSVTAKGGGVP